VSALVYVAGAAIAGALAIAGYLVGLRRFAAGARAELAALHAAADAGPAASAVAGRLPTTVHAVVLDGATNSGKSTWLHRIAKPWLDREALGKIYATQYAYRTRPVPVGYEWPDGGGGRGEPVALHALRVHDISGEKPEGVADHLEALAAEQRGAGRGRAPSAVVAVLVWDMADPMKSREHSTIKRLRMAYGTRNARPLVRHLVVFFNKIDLLPAAELARLIAFETDHIRSVTSFLGDDVSLTFVEGSALDGRGVLESYGAILARLGLASRLRPFEEDVA
jgi:hypothetical protein